MANGEGESPRWMEELHQPSHQSVYQIGFGQFPDHINPPSGEDFM